MGLGDSKTDISNKKKNETDVFTITKLSLCYCIAKKELRKTFTNLIFKIMKNNNKIVIYYLLPILKLSYLYAVRAIFLTSLGRKVLQEYKTSMK